MWRVARRRPKFGLPVPDNIKPSRTLYVKSSRDGYRNLNYIYDPSDDDKSLKKPLPVHINLHGSGFIMDRQGEDKPICWHLSRKLKCIVVDAGYRKAPEYQFPTPLYDIMDTVAYLQAHPSEFDASRITMGGFSAGANICLAATCTLPPGTIKAVVPWYPACEVNVPSRAEPGAEAALARLRQEEKESNDAAGPAGPGVPLGVDLRALFTTCYIPPGTDRTDPRLSPIYADAPRFPPVTLVCGTRDSLYPGCVNFVKHLKDGGVEVELLGIEGGQHAWERFTEPGTSYEVRREQAWEATERRLSKAFRM